MDLLHLLRTIVEFTPTQKDDELLARLEVFLKNDPELTKELGSVIMKMFLKLLRQK
jgi:hypothetical protein